MALTSAVEYDLKNAKFTDAFKEKRATWLKMAQDAYRLAKTVMADPKSDDVAPHLALMLAAHTGFRKVKSDKRLLQKHWDKDFADLIVAETWGEIIKGAEK
jgi:hypothetical protein